MKSLNQLKDFLDIAEQAQRIVESEADWKTKYEIIFSDAIMGRIKDTGIVIDWCGYITAYKEDVLTYVKALSDKAENVKIVWVLLQREGGENR